MEFVDSYDQAIIRFTIKGTDVCWDLRLNFRDDNQTIEFTGDLKYILAANKKTYDQRVIQRKLKDEFKAKFDELTHKVINIDQETVDEFHSDSIKVWGVDLRDGEIVILIDNLDTTKFTPLSVNSEGRHYNIKKMEKIDMETEVRFRPAFLPAKSPEHCLDNMVKFLQTVNRTIMTLDLSTNNDFYGFNSFIRLTVKDNDGNHLTRTFKIGS